jgi:Zn-dependent peptidase ImmA (M78 family)
VSKRKLKRPTDFRVNGFNWEIKYVDIDHETFGETDKDKKIVYIYTKDRSDQINHETLVHELFHAVLDDLADVIFHLDYDKNSDKEEQAIRLVTPRIIQFMQNNKHIMKYILEGV